MEKKGETNFAFPEQDCITALSVFAAFVFATLVRSCHVGEQGWSFGGLLHCAFLSFCENVIPQQINTREMEPWIWQERI